MPPREPIHGKWADVVRELNLDLAAPISEVTARDIKRITGVEPRIMGSMDNTASLPSTFRDRGLFVLPVSNGKYAIVRGKGYHDPGPIPGSIRSFPSTLPFPLIAPSVGMGEMQFVDLAFNAGLLEHFVGVDGLYLSIRGRKFSPPFDFRVDGSPTLHAEGVQVEIDGGFEGEHLVVVVEAKVNWQGDFIIRQLYYPYRFWQESLQRARSNKVVCPIFMSYNTAQGVYSFWRYRFRDPRDYESIELENAGMFTLEWKPLPLERLASVPPDTAGERRRIVPQADDVAKIAELPHLIATGLKTSVDLARHFSMDRRQGSYYGQAAEALGLVVLRGANYELTAEGLEYMQKPVPERNEMLCRRMLQLPLFHEALTSMLFATNRAIDRKTMMTLIRARGYSGTTLGRRTRTLLAWFEWIERTFGLVEVRRDEVSLERHQRRLDVI